MWILLLITTVTYHIQNVVSFNMPSYEACARAGKAIAFDENAIKSKCVNFETTESVSVYK